MFWSILSAKSLHFQNTYWLPSFLQFLLSFDFLFFSVVRASERLLIIIPEMSPSRLKLINDLVHDDRLANGGPSWLRTTKRNIRNGSPLQMRIAHPELSLFVIMLFDELFLFLFDGFLALTRLVLRLQVICPVEQLGIGHKVLLNDLTAVGVHGGFSFANVDFLRDCASDVALARVVVAWMRCRDSEWASAFCLVFVDFLNLVQVAR